MRDNEAKRARFQSRPGRESNCASTMCARKISNWTNMQQHNTRWQQQVIRRMFCRGTTDESMRLFKASPNRWYQGKFQGSTGAPEKFPIEQTCNNIIRDGSIKLFVGCSAEVLRTNRWGYLKPPYRDSWENLQGACRNKNERKKGNGLERGSWWYWRCTLLWKKIKDHKGLVLF